MNNQLNGKIALITGASRGIGKEVAIKLSELGAHVLLLARTVGALEEVDDIIKQNNGSSTLIPMDLLNLEDIDPLGPLILEKFGALDIFIGNAAMLGNLSPLTHSDKKEWDRVMSLNLTANFRLLRTLDPLLKASSKSRVIFTTSSHASKPVSYWGSYSVSKAALEMMVKLYAKENEKSNMCVNLVDPGVVKTELLDKAFPGGYQGKTTNIEDVANVFLELVSEGYTKTGQLISVSNKASKVA
jgi:NAD(P)-dependent dehydrogenase (short-subunit alcohol dehydrogenase family)